jgi:MFS family permease
VVIVARILQSLSVGGEYGAATAFLVEQDPKHRGFLASWQYASQSLTTILAAGFGAALNIALTPAQLIAGGWRIPPPTVAYFGGLLTGAIQLLLIPLVGLLSDRYGRTLMPLGAAVAILLLIYPLFAWLVAVPALSTLVAVQAVLGLLNALYLGCQGGLIAELFPSRVLGSGLAIGNALAVTIFGGFAPFIGVWLIETTGNPLAPSFYLMFGAAVSIVALTALRRPRFSRIEE